MSTHENEPDPIFPDRLSEDLRSLARVEMIVPGQIEDDLRAEAARYLAPRNRLRIYVRRATPLAAAAGLAITAGLALWTIMGKPNPGTIGISSETTIAMDIDESGRVDILDAFIIARALESGAPTDMAWDVTADGVVNILDIDAIAAAAVSLTERSTS